MIRHDWSMDELEKLHQKPLLDLISQSHAIHCQLHPIGEVQVCSLISIKTGGCPEDCKYCAQSSRYQTSVKSQPMMPRKEVVDMAKQAISQGATRICLGAAWRQVRDSKQFDEVLDMVKEIRKLGVEVCCTLGMLKEPQAKRLKEAGIYAYNHNLDSSERFYETIITTRTYRDRLDTLDTVEKSGLSVCCGGIIGMGETAQDRLELLLTLSRRNPHPESVPINQLTRIPGTPLSEESGISFWEVLRMVAIARIVMPKAMIRLSAGRVEMTIEQQGLCFIAGANSIFGGEKLLTVANAPVDRDREMFAVLGLKRRGKPEDRSQKSEGTREPCNEMSKK